MVRVAGGRVGPVERGQRVTDRHSETEDTGDKRGSSVWGDCTLLLSRCPAGRCRLSHLVNAQGAGLGSSGLATETAAGTRAQTYREPVWPSGKVLGCFSSKVVVCGHCFVTLSLTVNETLK